MTESPDTSARIASPAYRRWLAVGRAGWVLITLLAIGLILAGASSRYATLLAGYEQSLGGAGISAGAAASYAVTLAVAVVLVHVALAAVLFFKAPRDLVALLVAVTLSANGALLPLAFLYPAASVVAGWQFLLVGLVAVVGLTSSVFTLYLFPDGRFVPRWTLPLALLWALTSAAAVFAPTALDFSRWPLPVAAAVLLVWVITGLYAQVYRYNAVSDPAQRQQTKWAALGLLAAALTPLVYFLAFALIPSFDFDALPNQLVNRFGPALFALPALGGLLAMTLLALGMMVFPASFVIAVLRYRLWDIDRLVSRTLAYTLLTTTLLIIYLGIVVALQTLFGARSGESSPLAVVVSTLTIAALFSPLRRRIQAAIDRRFYRRKYDAQQVLARFAQTARDETDLDALQAELVAVVRETMQPAFVRVMLFSGKNNDEVHPARSPGLTVLIFNLPTLARPAGRCIPRRRQSARPEPAKGLA